MEEKPQIQGALDPRVYSLGGLNVNFNEEEFVLLLINGNQAVRYSCSPKHAKRIKLLFERIIGDYESKFGELKTELPTTGQDNASTKEGLGFKMDK